MLFRSVIGDQGRSAARSSNVAANQPAPAADTGFTERKHAVSGPGINNLDFQRGEQGEGNVIISLTDPNLTSDIQDEGGKIRVSFPRANLPETLRVRLDVKDFATPVQFVNASQSSDTVSIVIEPSGHYDYLAYQSGDKLTISVKPLTREEKEKRIAESFAYTGEKLSQIGRASCRERV